MQPPPPCAPICSRLQDETASRLQQDRIKLRHTDAAVELLYREKVQASPDNAREVLHNHERLVWLDGHILQATELKALSGATQVAKALQVLRADR